VSETPELYHKITEPYITNFPPSRTQWYAPSTEASHCPAHFAVLHAYRVTEILSGRAEQNKVLFSSSEFIIIPDMKWDLHTVGSLYLLAIVRDPNLRSLRDLRGDLEIESLETKKRKLDSSVSVGEATEPGNSLGVVELLKSIRREAYRVTGENWGILPGRLRMWIHYQPSYCRSYLSPDLFNALFYL